MYLPLDKNPSLREKSFSAGASMRTGNPVVLMFLFKLLFPNPGDNNSFGLNAILCVVE